MMEDTSTPLIETEDIEQKNLGSSTDIKLEDSPLQTKQEDIQVEKKEEKVDKKETDKAEEKENKKEEEEEEEDDNDDDDDEDDFEIIPTLAAMTTTSEWEQGAKHDFTETTNTASRRLSIKEYESDPWAEPESGLLLETEEVQESTPVLSAVEDDNNETMSEVKEPLDQDTSPLKGFQNFEPTDKIDDLNVNGNIPEWLIGEHFTVGPGTFDVKYSRKTEIDGLLQNVTAKFSFGHWFDALPLVNRFDLNGQRNTVTYRNRLTSKRLIEKIRDHHGYAPSHPAGLYMSSTNQTVLTKFLKNSPKAKKPDAEPCGARVLANIPGLEGRLLVQNHANHIQELDPFDLKPVRVLTWNEVNPAFKGTSSCPNGQYDQHTGEYINFTMQVGYQSVSYNFFSISDRDPKGKLLAAVTAPMAYVSTFSITRRYIVLVMYPMLANAGGVKYNWCESLMDSFSFRPNEPTLFYVISREKGEVTATYRSDACFAFNHVNAYEDDRDNIFIDMICYPDDTIARQLSTESLRNPGNMKPSRLVSSEVRRYMLANIDQERVNYMANNTMIPSKTSVTTRISSMFGYFKGGKNTTHELEYGNTRSGSEPSAWCAWMPVAAYDKRVQPSIELPCINPSFRMKKHTFMYGLGFSASSALQDGAIWDSIVKTNLDTKTIVASWHQDFCYPSEAVFIPRPPIGPEDEVAEDEGVLISVVLDSSRKTSFLLILDATTLSILATADIGQVLPLSFSRGSYRLRD